MSIDNKNCCKTSFQDYQKYSVKRFVAQIPKDRRVALAEEVKARANLFGCKDESLLHLVLARLNG